MMSILPDVEAEMRRIVSEAQKQNIFLRLVGGLAFKMHCPDASHRALERNYPDIDFVTDKASSIKLLDFFPALGYVPNKTLNTLSGDRRQLYYDEVNGRQIDIFIGDFEMCHKLPMTERTLHVEPLTVPLAELFLTKAQIFELNRKDVLDLMALLLGHPVGRTDNETINADIIAGLCARDWGLCTTVSLTIEKLNKILAQNELALAETQVQTVRERLAAIEQAMAAAPKSLGWKLRAKIGTRLRWYEEVEEVRR
ncbi:MAG: hypothetical protein AB1801_15085 [Chloroflexota bacterium]